MITYLYWALVIGLAFGLVFLFGARMGSWKGAAVSALVVLLYSGRLTVPTVFMVMGAACAVASLGWFATQSATFRFVPGRFWEHWSENWVFGRWAMCSHVLGCAMTYAPWPK